MMFQDAIYEAQNRGADYVAYSALGGAVKIVDVATMTLVATVDLVGGYPIMCAGISARRASLLDYDAGEFVCGDLSQLVGSAA
jgi:hypothetical protein